MKNLTSNEIRQMWLKFFEAKGHYIIPSASLIPVNDKSLLWINSGVATLKPYFDGRKKPPSLRMANLQKVIRTGDIDIIGISANHHTFFEMLGNFSIGDYFKNEAIEFAWEFLTSKKWLGIDKKLLYVTVFNKDINALNKWKEIGVPLNRIFKMGKETNFWDMGKGPSGPSSEIFFDKGINYDSRNAKDLIKSNLENDRFVEIWNIVFSEFNNDGKGNYKELPQKNIDTGAGLERIASILQKKPSNFETDLFIKLIKKIDSKTNYNYDYNYIPSKLFLENKKQFYINSWFKKIADYVRSVSFAISDGALPESTGRGYIIRMLIRKAVINKLKLKIKENFLHDLVDPLVKTMKNYYPNIEEKKYLIIKIIKEEEEKFNRTLSVSIDRMNKEIDNNNLNEKVAYKLHETFGLPLEVIKEFSENDKRINLDWNIINKLDKEFKEKSKGSNTSNDAMKFQDDRFENLKKTKFVGYKLLETEAKVIFIFEDKVVFDKTPFYATSGGQESDFGLANNKKVKYVQKNSKNVFIHFIPNHKFLIGDKIKLSVDKNRRLNLMKHHSATHLLFSALEKATGKLIPQQGSKVEQDFLRFDFSYQGNIDEVLLNKVEIIANKWIKDSTNVQIKNISLDEAKKMNASYLEGIKYGKIVRVVFINNECIDMCGGTHVSNTSEIEKILITKIEKRGSGIWRLEAIAGELNISKFILKTNSKIKDDYVSPILNKIFLVNKKAEELGESNLNIQDKINSLDETSISYKKEIKFLLKTIEKEISNKINSLNSIMKNKLKNSLLKNSISIFRYKSFNVQEITKLLLNIIDKTKSNMAVVIINNGNKVSYGFVLAKRNVNDKNINRIKLLIKNNGLKGNGKKQQYIFGGESINNSLIIDEIKKWEF